MHFLIGYDRGLYASQAVGVKIKTAPGYDPGRPSETIGSDWALITLDTRLGSADRILPMLASRLRSGVPSCLAAINKTIRSF